MDEFKINPRSLALLLSFLIIPKLSVIFINMLSRENGNWLWSYDPIIIIGYSLFVLMYFLFWLKGRTSPNIAASIPAAIIHSILGILIIVPALAALAFSMGSLKPLLSTLVQILVWVILVLVVFVIPYLTIRGDFTNKQKTLTVLAAVAFLVSPSYGPVLYITGLFRSIVETGNLKLVNGIYIGLLTLYFIPVVLLYISEVKADGRFAFISFCAGLALMTYGLANPVNYGTKAGSSLVTTYIGNVEVSSTVVRHFDINAVIIAGVVVLGLLYITMYSDTIEKNGT